MEPLSPACNHEILTYLTYSSYNRPLSAECSPVLPTTREHEISTMLNVTENIQFSSFNKQHAKKAAKAIETLMTTKNKTDFYLTAMIFRGQLPYAMFYFILNSAMSHHKDFLGAGIPNSFYTMPCDYFPDPSLSTIASDIKNNQRGVLEEWEKGNFEVNKNITKFVRNFLKIKGNNTASKFKKNTHSKKSKHSLPHKRTNRQETNKKLSDIDLQKIVTIKSGTTGDDRDPEHRLWYFREDIPLNSFHWHWHVINPPITWFKPSTDRRGELFAYVHHQLLQRYNTERLAFNLTKVKPLNNWNETIKEGYFPHLMDGMSHSEYSPRSENVVFKSTEASMNEMISWTKNIKEAIKNRTAINKENQTIILDEVKGIDIISAMVESTSSSPNEELYGDLHNNGHIIIASLHDPDGKFNTSFGVMSSTKTAMRDPLFYRWHQFVDDFFIEHQRQLPPYIKSELDWECITVKNFFLLNENKLIKNKIYTYFSERVVDVSRGLDFTLVNESVLVKIDHLNHDDFTYIIKVNNPTKRTLNATVRIYLAAGINEKQEEANDMELYNNFFDMDTFRVKIRPGMRVITRSSKKSSIMSNPNHTWKNIANEPFRDNRTDEERLCICGWPYHLLVPRGTTEGLKFHMLVFITDYEKDKVDNLKTKKSKILNHCTYGSRFCGIIGNLYPDKRAMGFPFDRTFEFNKKSPFSREFFNRSNMFLSNVIIYHQSDNSFI